MPSAFDNMQSGVFGQARSLFGYPAAWVSVDTEAQWSGKVLFKNPTENIQNGSFAYDPYRYEMEYFDGDFPGLLERVEARNSVPETVTVDGKQYEVRDITAAFDGKTYKATLQPVPDI